MGKWKLIERLENGFGNGSSLKGRKSRKRNGGMGGSLKGRKMNGGV